MNAMLEIDSALKRIYPPRRLLNGWSMQGLKLKSSGEFTIMLSRYNQHKYIPIGDKARLHSGEGIHDLLMEATSPVYDLSDMD